jgi:nucleotide-binding universal stress UspA family protein
MMDLVKDMPCEMRHVFHPTDFSPASMAAFGYALKLSLGMRSDLTIMHVDPARADPDFEDFPRVRATLIRWGMLKEGATKEDLLALDLGVRKIRAMAETPVPSILQLLWRRPADLMVLATHPQDRLDQWLSEPIGESLARKSRTMSLFVPDQSRGLVSLDTGAVSMQRILIPVDHRPLAQTAVDAACIITAALGVQIARFDLLYVGAKANLPNLHLPRQEGWTWHQNVTTGVVVDEIFDVATWLQPDLIVMATEWRHGFLDALRGSTTARILRRTTCPLLAVPSG